MLDGLKLKFQYSKEAIFNVVFTDKTISYVSVGELYRGARGTYDYKLREVEKDLYFIQWVDGGTGDFLSMVVDLKYMKIYSSVRSPNQGDLFINGTITKLI